MAYSMALRSNMRYGVAKKKPQKIKIDGKEYDISEFDDTRWWSAPKKKPIKRR